MRHLMWTVAALAGCNQIFGLSNTELVDGPPLIDAKYLGGTPQFSAELHQRASACSNYTETEDGRVEIAVCGGAVAEWDPTQGFVAIPALALTTAADPRISPEGDELYVVTPQPPATSAIDAYRRDSTGQWQHDRTIDPGVALGNTVYLGAPTRGPTRRMVISDYNNFSMFDEYEIELDASSAHVFHHYTLAELGGALLYFAPYLSPDGLRMYYSAQAQPMLYFDRPDIATVFASPRTVPTAPEVHEAFMTADCARLYLYSSDLQNLFWVQQQ
jgi:hypothetical protein